MSLISDQKYQELFKDYAMEPSTKQLRTYSGELMEVTGQMQVTVQYQEQRAKLPLYVVKGTGPSLLGRNWLSSI